MTTFSLCPESTFPWLPEHILFWFSYSLACYPFLISSASKSCSVKVLSPRGVFSSTPTHSLCGSVQGCGLKYHLWADNFQIHTSSLFLTPECHFLYRADLFPIPNLLLQEFPPSQGNGSSTLPVTLLKNPKATLDLTHILHSTNQQNPTFKNNPSVTSYDLHCHHSKDPD